jgi:uncharacterized protein (TIGR02231 family)
MDISLLAKIEDVTVYPDRARVVARGEAELTEEGAHRLLFDDLPLTIDRESVRVGGRGTARVRVSGVEVVSKYYEHTPSSNARELEEAIEKLMDEIKIQKDKEQGLKTHMQYLAGLWQATGEYAWGLARGRNSVQGQTELVQFLREQDLATKAEQREIEQTVRQLNRKLQKLQQELNLLRSARPTQRYQAIVEVEVLAAGTFKAELTYVVSQAGWQPLYDLRLLESSTGRGVELTYIAQITQNSGQDWRGVSLTVSTARPALNQRLPELQPWFIDVYVPAPPPQAKAKGFAMLAKPMSAPAPISEADLDMTLGAEMEEADEQFGRQVMQEKAAEVAVAQVETTGSSVTFRVGGSIDIPSDGSPHKTVVGQFNFKPEMDYIAIPRHTDAVYRRVTIKNSSASPLLAGPANLLVNDEFIGKTHLQYTPTDGDLKLMLGVEDRVTVKRELAKREVDKKFLSDKRRLRYGYKIELENLLEQEVKVELQDQLPVSRSEKVNVMLSDIEPNPSKQSDLNLLEWVITLAPKAKRLVRYEYVVEHSASLTVVGLMD